MSLEDQEQINNDFDQLELVSFFDLLLRIDKRVNPSEYDDRYSDPNN